MKNITGNEQASACYRTHRRTFTGTRASAVALSLMIVSAACAPDDGQAASTGDVTALAQQGGFTGDQRLYPLNEVFYEIIAENSAKCLDLYRDSNRNDTQAVQYSCGGVQPSQMWAARYQGNGYVSIQSRLESGASTKCLDVSHQSRSNNASVVLFDCLDQPSQRWRIEYQDGATINLSGSPVDWRGAVSFRNELTGKCLTVDHVSSSDNASIVQYDCNGGTNQNWKRGLLFVN